MTSAGHDLTSLRQRMRGAPQVLTAGAHGITTGLYVIRAGSQLMRAGQ